MTFKISFDGLKYIMGKEKFMPKWYLCPAGVKTIGYGHAFKSGDIYTMLSEIEAETLLMKDLGPFETGLNLLNLSFGQNEFDASTSFVFNLGLSRFTTSKTAISISDLIKQNKKADALRKWATYDKIKVIENGIEVRKPLRGLTLRRREEILTFNKDQSVLSTDEIYAMTQC